MFNLEQGVRSFKAGKLISAYTGVIVHTGQNSAGEEVDYTSGDTTGYVLEVDIPDGNQEVADSIFAALKLRGYKYQPYSATGALLDPAAEVGDTVEIDGVSSLMLSIETKHSHLMSSSISAPYDEEVDHEYTYKSRTQREFKRESAYTRARLTIAEDNITAEVVRATASEETLSGLIAINATAITAKVSKTGGSPSSFAWTLTDSSWKLTSNNTDVLVADASGLSVSGRITATSGFIGTAANGFAIDASNIHNGMTSLNDTTNNGVYVGTDGIALGKGAFKVTSGGAVTCSSITITGGSVYADAIQYDGKGGASVGGTFNGAGITPLTVTGGSGGKISSGTITTVNTTSGINTNLGLAANYGLATTNGTSVYPDYFKAGQLVAVGAVSCGLINVYNTQTGSLTCTIQAGISFASGYIFRVKGYDVSWKTVRYVSDIVGGVPEYTTVYVLGR